MNEYKIHYYGQLDSLDSCYAYERIDIDSGEVYIQCSTRFGGKALNLRIDSPKLFLHYKKAYYYFVIEDFTIQTNREGKLVIDKICLKGIVEQAIESVIR